MKSAHRSRSPWRLSLIAPWILLAACADGPSPAAPAGDAVLLSAAANRPVQLEFHKCIFDPVNFVWRGTVSGDVEGNLTTVLNLDEFRVTGAIWHVRFDWIIDAGTQSFTADLSGTLNTITGGVVMNGRVVEGSPFLAGARVHEEGQLVDPDLSCFAGTIRIMPATAW